MQQKNTDAILEWSKWVTGLSLFSATGCISVLIGKGVSDENLPFIKVAISLFLLTIFLAWSIQLLIAIIKGGYYYQVMGLSIIKFCERLIKIEFIVFGLSLLFFAMWIWRIGPNKVETERKINVIVEKNKSSNDTLVIFKKVLIPKDTMICIKLER